MKKQSINLLKCINCGNEKLELKNFNSTEKEVLQGKIICPKCNSNWPIINGIPRILKDDLLKELTLKKFPLFFKNYKDEFHFSFNIKASDLNAKVKTAKSFGYEWNKYSQILDIFEKDWERYFNPVITKEWVKDKTIVDVGCGLAKHGYFTAKYGAKYVGVDLSDAVEDAYKNTKNFDSLIVQADIFDMPINGKKVDLFYSIGVIHHLPDPKAGFLKIASHMQKKGAQIFIWVYGRKGNNRAIYFYNPIRVITTKIPKKIMDPLCHIPAIGVHSINLATIGIEKIGFKKLAKKMPFYYYTKFPYSFKHNDSFDVLATPTQEYYHKKDIAKWFEDAKIKDFKLLDDKYQGIKGFGRVK